MAFASLAERRAIQEPFAEGFVGPGAEEVQGVWSAASDASVEIRSSNPMAVFPCEDVYTWRRGDVIWRKAKSREFTIRDIDPDGIDGFTIFELEPVIATT